MLTGMSNDWIAVSVRKISATSIEGTSSGRVISRNWVQREAPSTSAAS